MAYIYDLTDTWNAGGTTFNGIKLNVTDSASAVSSKLITLQTNGTEHFSVTKAGVGYFSGNVGIGTSSPSSKLTVAASNVTVNAGYGIAFTGDQTRIMTPEDNVYGALINWGASGGCRFFQGTTERMRIDGSGNVIVGGTAGNGRLTVRGAGTGAAYSFETATSGGNTRFIVSDNGEASFYNSSNAISMRINSSGNVGIGTSAPGYRLDVNSGDTANTLNISSNSLATYNPAAYNGASARVFMRGGNSVGTFTGTQYTHGGNFEAFFGAVQNASNLADFVFQGYNGSAYEERVRITSAGNVGININKVFGSGNGYAGNTSAASSATLELWDTSGNTKLFNVWGSGNLLFGTANSERMRIDASGNVGIGTSSPANKLQSTYSVSSSAPAAGATGHGFAVGSTGFGLAVGALTSGNAYLQATRWDGIAANYDIVLQPNGGNVGIGTSAFGTSASGVLGLGNATAPTTSPAGMGQLYVEGGALKFRGSSGTVTTIAPA